jgi:hypothetical protein
MISPENTSNQHLSNHDSSKKSNRRHNGSNKKPQLIDVTTGKASTQSNLDSEKDMNAYSPAREYEAFEEPPLQSVSDLIPA